jgi:hypothetical protein
MHEPQTCRDQTNYYNFPANEANFVSNDQTLNANISKATTKVYHSMDLWTYLWGKHDRLNTQIDDIWWKAHHKSIYHICNAMTKQEFKNLFTIIFLQTAG